MAPRRAARLLYQLPNKSRVFRAIEPANNWGWTQILLNRIGYYTEVLAWQKTKDGQKKSPKNAPKLYTPEFMVKAEETKAINQSSIATTTDEIKAILARPRR